MGRRVADLYERVRHLGPELVKFGIVGGIGTIVDLGGAAALHSKYGMGPLTAKALSISVAAVVTYLGSRYWTFRHRENQSLLREGGLFVGLNVIGLLIAEGVIACTTYVLGYKDPIAYNVASLAGTGLGTIFRYYAYRRWVFLAPAAPPEPAVPGFAAYPHWSPAQWESARWESAQWGSAQWGSAQWGSAQWERADWQPAEWEPALVAAYSAPQGQHPRQARQSNSFIPNGAVMAPMVTATATPWSSAPVTMSAPVSPARSAPHPAPAGARAPGRHRKQR